MEDSWKFREGDDTSTVDGPDLEIQILSMELNPVMRITGSRNGLMTAVNVGGERMKFHDIASFILRGRVRSHGSALVSPAQHRYLEQERRIRRQIFSAGSCF